METRVGSLPITVSMHAVMPGASTFDWETEIENGRDKPIEGESGAGWSRGSHTADPRQGKEGRGENMFFTSTEGVWGWH